MKKILLFDLTWHDAIKDLPEYDRLGVYEAIFEYAKTRQLPEDMTGVKLALCKVICNDIPFPEESDECSDVGTEEE